jgi:ketosteroid isomerase-like protein
VNISCIRKTFVLIGGLAWALTASAHEPVVASSGMPAFVQDIAPAAADAVKVVDAFSAAIKAVKLDEAAKLLDPKVLILESGSSERSRDEYLGEHAIADAAFMQTATQQPRYRQAQASGDVAWVGTESLLETTRDGKPLLLLSTETMVLKRTEPGWRIVHIHWSSRPAPKN